MYLCKRHEHSFFLKVINTMMIKSLPSINTIAGREQHWGECIPARPGKKHKKGDANI
jgi:hypothetical protein